MIGHVCAIGNSSGLRRPEFVDGISPNLCFMLVVNGERGRKASFTDWCGWGCTVGFEADLAIGLTRQSNPLRHFENYSPVFRPDVPRLEHSQGMQARRKVEN